MIEVENRLPAQHSHVRQDLSRVPGGKAGAVLGRKGAQTRARLLAATRELLQAVSPFQLTVVAIAKAARTASATLYVYFDDVEDVLYELACEACADFKEMLDRHREWFSQPENIAQHAQEFIDQFNLVWDRHSHVLLYRNLEADRGNLRFLELRTTNAIVILERLTAAVRDARPSLSRVEAQSDAVVLFSAVERLAGTRQNYAAMRRSLPLDELRRAQARVIVAYLART